ncbi:ABC transporter permease [Edaphobacter modestus]|uniref:ABC-2 type transport system permease protein n=1 Tax=Edaphobacter modestus TaxID=388466 RepID=A0A4V2G4W3_9BACT|nr:ABC transporter permease [Edaphobacter modestus]RZU42536.1 ABC-2 type transport system permease protein [Edaphobacter modestus]
MHNVWLIAKREYLERVRTKAFLISTLMIPLLMGGGIVGSIIASSKTKSTSHITIVSPDQQLATDLQKELEHGKDSEMTVDVISPGNSATKASLDSMLADKQIDGYLWITPASDPNARPSFAYTPRSTADISTKSTITSALRTVLMRERLSHDGLVARDVDSLMEPVKVDTTQAGKNADTTSSFVAIYVLFFLMYMVILLYGMNVARSIIEEKTSRVFEVLLATIKPEEMMAGKVIGVGSVGLTQVAVWLLTAILLTSGSWIGAIAGGNAHVSLSAMQIIFFVVYFLLGYLLYSSIAAALGAMVNSEQELQQLNMILVMPLAGCMFALAPVISNPSGPIARIISLIPFCTPLIMYLRISLATPPAWEIALSIVLMIVTIYAILWVASRIYRVGILMYGKRPSLPEIMRWLKYS